MFDRPLWTTAIRVARSWGLAALVVAVAGMALADWAASRYPAVDDTITGSIAPRATAPKERSTRVIRSVLSDQPIVIRQ